MGLGCVCFEKKRPANFHGTQIHEGLVQMISLFNLGDFQVNHEAVSK